MKKLYFSIVLLLASITPFVAQQKPTAVHECGADRVHLENLKSTSDYKMNFDKQNIDYQTWVLKQPKIKLKTLDHQAYTPPPLSPQHLLTVVFHDMLLPNATPVTIDNYGYIVEGLNAIFSGTNLGGKQDANDTGIRFCSAQQDDNGKSYTLAASRPSTSILSIDNEQSPPLAINTTISESKFSNNATLGSNFSTKKFINIYIVDNIVGNVAGFAYMPPSHGSFRDGIFIERAFLKNDANFANNINVLAHEMGHYLGLFHIFGICSPDVLPTFPQCSCDNGNPLFNGDMVADTPPSQLNVTQTNCATTFDTCPLSAGNDDKANYMDYGNWNCQYKFSLGQIQRMRFMIDPETGPRKSLLASQNACTDCTAMSGIGFSIVAPAGMGVDPHFALNSVGQVQAGVFTVSATTTATTTTIPVLQYTWSIVAVNGNNTSTVIGSNATTASYTVPDNLAIGNYRLTLRVGTSVTCFKDLSFDFQVLPHTPAGSCNLSLPSDDSWAGWNRSSYVNGWQYGSAPTFALISGAARYTPTDANFDHSGFAVITNPQTNLNDSRFATASNLPMTVTKVIRVGRKIENAGTPLLVGNAYYASVPITPTQANCKFRIWYLGYRESNIVLYNDTYQLAAAETNFGFVTEYRFNSTLAPTAGVNTIIGSSEYGPVTGSTGSLILNNGLYNHNDLMSMCLNDSSDSFNNYAMAGWKFFDVDYSEFIGSGLNTELTLTFFARSNTAQNALQSSYCYYAVECLGSGVPKNYSLNLPDIDLSCGKASDGICSTKSIIPAPNYGIKRQNQDNIPNRISLFWAQQPNNLGKIKIYKEATTGIFNEYDTTVTGNGGLGYALSTIYKPLLCMNSVDAPRKRFIIEVETLHKIVRDTITVSAGFYALPPLPPVCSVPDKAIGGSIPEGVSSTVSICASAPTMPLLVMNNPCWAPSGQGLQYQWFTNAGLITGATAKDYQITNYDAANGLSRFYREVYYENPYCKGTGTWLPSEIYIINTITLEILAFTFLPRPDFCQNSIIPINLAGLNIGAIPIGSTLSSNPTVTFAIIYQNTVVSAITVSCTVSPINQVTIPSSATISFNNMVSNGSFILPVGNSILYLRVIKNISTIQNCSFGSLDYQCDVFIKPSAGGGQILYNCLANNITSVSDGVAGTNGYQWQYSATTAGTFATFANASTTPTLATAQLNQIAALLGTNIFFVRRVSTPFGQCPNISNSNAVRVNMSTQNQTPAFTQLPTSICQGTPAPVLPTTSNNLIGGNWVALNNSTATVKNFEFVPLPSQCVTTPNVTYSYTIKSIITPTFALPVSICANVPLSLPTISENDIAGVWSPNIVSQTGVYTFTPASGTCALAVSKTITVIPVVAVQFSGLSANNQLCQNAMPTALPSQSSTGINGIWKNQNGAVVTTTSSAQIGSFAYTFSPTNSSGCGSRFVFTQTIKNATIVPLFAISSQICAGNTAPVLPTISTNGIEGSWQPAIVNNMTSGSYKFTPKPGQCAINPRPINVTIQNNCDIILGWSSNVGCQQQNGDPRKYDANIQDAACLRICSNSQVSYSLSGGVSGIASTNWIVTGGTLKQSTSTSCTIAWGSEPFSSLQIIIIYTNGATLSVTKCIEKVASPVANFGAYAYDIFDKELKLSICEGTTLQLKNLTSTNQGNSVLYFNWSFGDGTYSSEFEPQHLFTQEGDYLVTLTVSNGCSCVGKITKNIHVIKGFVMPIACQSTVCDGDISRYTVDLNVIKTCNQIEWVITGGEIVYQNSLSNIVDVLWNSVPDNGFGIIKTTTNNCEYCSSVMKIPIIKQAGAIQGVNNICIDQETMLELPQWPSTDFVWSIENASMQVSLLTNNQRNQINVKAARDGVFDLVCNYKNTLLNCSGTARKQIRVKPSLKISGNMKVCANVKSEYTWLDNNGSQLNGVSWTVSGPNNFVQTGINNPFIVNFLKPGLYNFAINSANYCITSPIQVEVLPSIVAPTAIQTVTPVCPGTPVTYSCIAPQGTQTTWAVTNGTIIGSSIGNTVQINFNADATTPFVVTTYFTSPVCISSLLQTTIPRVTPKLTLVRNNTPVCSSSLATYAVGDQEAESYSWSIIPQAAGSIDAGQNTKSINVLWNELYGVQNIKLVVRKCGKDYTQLYPVTVISAPSITLNLPAQTICNDTANVFSFSMTPGTTFSSAVWDFGDGSPAITVGGFGQTIPIMGNSTRTHTYSSPLLASANYTVTLVVRGANGCLNPVTMTKQITVSPSPIIDISPASMGCLTPPPAIFYLNIQGGFAQTNAIRWYKVGTPDIEISNNLGGASSTLNVTAPSLGIGMYYAVVQNIFRCAKKSNIVQYSNCPGGIGCSYPFAIDATVTWSCGTITAQNADISNPAVQYSWSNTLGATPTISSPSYYSAAATTPGRHILILSASANVNGSACGGSKQFPYIIPYKAALKYNVTCNGNNAGYNVTLLDASVYFPETPITNFLFQVDGGTWQPSTLAGGINQLVVPNLLPGTHTVGIKIWHNATNSYAPCTAFETLILPAYPNADFAIPATVCQDMPMPFFAPTTDNTPYSTYYWNFEPFANNIQPNPVRTFSAGGPKQVTLTVKNQYGCSSTVTKGVMVRTVNMKGNLKTVPLIVCTGSTLNVKYDGNLNTTLPSRFYWYKSSNPNTLLSSTSTGSYTVSQSGSYFAIIEDANGCQVYTTEAVTANIMPTPPAPLLTGPNSVCAGSTITVKTAAGGNGSNRWTLNGVAQPLWNNLSVVNIPNAADSQYKFAVTSAATNNGVTCSGASSTLLVQTYPLPQNPILGIVSVQNNPYKVVIQVTNPEAGAIYFWSNGTTGITTTSTKSGPLSAYAVKNGCSTQKQPPTAPRLTNVAQFNDDPSQINLPVNLDEMGWVFPKGCYSTCEGKPTGTQYILGPLGTYSEWQWLMGGSSVQAATGQVPSFSDLYVGNNYQMLLHNGAGSATFSNLTWTMSECAECQFTTTFSNPQNIIVKDKCFTKFDFCIDNPHNFVVYITLTNPTGEGFFTAAPNNFGGNTFSMALQPGNNCQQLFFYAANGYMGGTPIDVLVKATGIGQTPLACNQRLKESMPIQCENATQWKTATATKTAVFYVAPNPAKESSTLYYDFYSATSNSTLLVIDMLGRIVANQKLTATSGSANIDLTQYMQGTYIVRLVNNGIVLGQSKLIKN